MKTPEGWTHVETGPGQSKENRVLEPEKPIEFLQDLIDKAPSAVYPGNVKRGQFVAKRREVIKSCLEKIDVIGSELTEAFIAAYANHNLKIEGGVRFYIVGGRLESKVLSESSDLDCAFTVVDAREDMRPRYGEEPKELTDRKKAARQEFVYGPLRSIATKYGFMLKDTLTDGKPIEGSLLEPKEYGCPDEEFKKRNLPAVLVCTI